MVKKGIIIVEDERIIAEDIKDTLINQDYEVLGIFSQGETAVEQYAKLAPDLILMDIMLAGELNGIQTASRIHEKSNIPIIYLTAYANENILEKAKVTEPYGYLIKPFEERELHATIEMAFYRHKLEEEIKTTQHRLTTVFQNVPSIVLYESGADRNFISDNINKMLDFPQERHISSKQEIYNLMPDKDMMIVQEKIKNWEEKNRSGMLTVWFRIKKANAKTIWIEDRMIEITSPQGQSYITGVMMDNTNLKQTEIELKKSRSRYRAIVEDQTEFICRFDANHTITFANDAYCRFAEKEIIDLIGSNWNDEIPTAEKEFIDKILTNLNINNPTEIHEFWVQNKNKKVYTEWTFRAIYNDQQEFLEFQAVGKDTTLRKEAEVEKEKIREQLYQSQKMELIGNLAGGIAHDFNNLLTAINGYADIAMKKLDENSPVFSDIKIIKDCGLKAAALTKQLLGFSRKQIVEKKVIDLNVVIEELNKMLLRLIGDNVSLRLQLSDQRCLVSADGGQIEQLLINLIVNARDALPQGGDIIIKTYREFIDDAKAKKHQIETIGWYEVISVEDNGTGIQPEYLDKIYEPFFTTKEVGKGTGLGLATVFGITKQNKGHIEVESEVGKGTTFFLFLPAVETEEVLEELSQPQELENEENAGGSETILLVEDEAAIREFVSSILDEYGYRVLEAENGRQGLNKAEQFNGKIHLLLSDIRMPKMTGPQLAEKIKQIQPDIKILFVSGHTDNDQIRREIEQSKAGFLQKPFSYNALVEKVRTELDKK